jgi:hypothetical protein
MADIKNILKSIGLVGATVGAGVLNTATGGMTAPLTATLLHVLGNAIPDPVLKAQLAQAALDKQAELEKAELDQATQIYALAVEDGKAQAAVNQAEAENKSLFVAGWRPFVGWVCGCALAYALFVQPFLQFCIAVFHWQLDPAAIPKLNTAEAIELLIPMLGLGAMRTLEKVNGAAKGMQ